MPGTSPRKWRRGWLRPVLQLGQPPVVSGPPVPPLSGPVGVRVILQRAGSAQASSIVVAAPPAQAVFYQRNKPAGAVIRPLPPRGRTQGRSGTFSQAGPPFYPLNKPVQSRQPLPRKGTSATMVAVALSYSGPPFYPLNKPVQSRQPLPQRGRAQGRQGTPPVVIVNQTVAYPLHSPVAAVVRPQPPRGRAAGRAGTFGIPNLTVAYPLGHPVQARQPLPARGRVYSRAGVRHQTGPQVKALQHPVMAFRNVPRPGYTATSIRPLPPSGTGSKFYPARKPIRAPFPPLQRRTGGQAGFTPPYVPPFVPAGGHAYPYKASLAGDLWYTAITGGRWTAVAGPPSEWFAALAGGQWSAGFAPARWDTALMTTQ